LYEDVRLLIYKYNKTMPKIVTYPQMTKNFIVSFHEP